MELEAAAAANFEALEERMQKTSSLLLVAASLLAFLASPTFGQNFRPPSMAGIVSLLRFQNTACHSDQDESGTCLADAECSRRAGISIGTCANNYGTCCSFKVSPRVGFRSLYESLIDD